MSDKKILYDLASRVSEVAHSPEMQEHRRLWRNQNSFKGDRPLIYLRAFGFDETFDLSVLKCTDPFLRHYERELHQELYRSTLGDDYIVEPWLTLDATYVMENGQRWGIPVALGEKPAGGGAAAFHPSLVEEDISCLRAAPYEVNEEETARRAEKLSEALGGAMRVFVSRQGPYSMWSGDISTDLAKMRGLEQLMWDTYDNPEWLHTFWPLCGTPFWPIWSRRKRPGDFPWRTTRTSACPTARSWATPIRTSPAFP